MGAPPNTAGVVAAGALVAALSAPLALASDLLAEFPRPHGAESRLVGADLIQNGHPVSIATLEPNGTLEETLAFYRERWKGERDGGPGFIESEAGGWAVISRLEDDHNLVVQLRAGEGGVEGFVSVLSLEPASTPIDPPPLPPGGELVSSTVTSDVGSEAATSVVVSSQRSGEVVAFYRDRLPRDGWTLASEGGIDGPATLAFERERARLELVVGDADDGTTIVLNEVHDR